MKTLFTFTLLFLLSSLTFAQVTYEDDCLDNLVIPESFSPNEDGSNDVFSIDFPCPPEELEIKMYDRWGKEIFGSDDYRFKWTGTDDKNQPFSAGTYIWSLKYTFNGAEVSKKGSITLTR